MKIGILTAGGDCPGINAAIRSVGKTAILNYGMEVCGISDGFRGLLTKKITSINEEILSGLLTLGGTILGTSREKPFQKSDIDEHDKPQIIKENYKKLGFDALVIIGGNGTMKTAQLLQEEGINVVGIPKTIDNDVWGTDITFGFDTAFSIATDAIDRLHTTANSHNRIMIIEVMGHNAGWIALYSGIAGGGDAILIPELGYNENDLAEFLIERDKSNKKYSIVVVAEGLKLPESKKSPGRYFAKRIRTITGLETRETILGYVQRGGTPTPTDRVLATRYGSAAVDLLVEGNFGKMVALKNDKIVPIDLKEVAGKIKVVSKNHPLIKKSKGIGTFLGTK